MFVDELTPLMREMAHQPMAFLGGLCSGLLRLDLSDDPVKSWLNQQGASTTAAVPDPSVTQQGPKSIDIE
ncbi:hypothetical protein IQ241_18740 [Romeria aff. gracilis LEGE 07310]|uniref:Uncharacterized protein n=1 Tax=Vasconcelosia minhoensis LEGE 07310 TaxID=915328 RepID=A0A8J7AXH4_9CYAN|nr:hypothetical protein [Romeria gracilis]MBE9079308.1 hypothetical protein [Romeria aff. gracilis LEGE 07310]